MALLNVSNLWLKLLQTFEPRGLGVSPKFVSIATMLCVRCYHQIISHIACMPIVRRRSTSANVVTHISYMGLELVGQPPYLSLYQFMAQLVNTHIFKTKKVSLEYNLSHLTNGHPSSGQSNNLGDNATNH